MDNDDAPIGRVLTRREVVALLGVSGVALLTGSSRSRGSSSNPRAALPQCIVRPQQTEGPYFVDERMDRSDIRPDPASGKVSAGVPLVLAFNVSRVSGSGCSPLAGAQVDVWQCDAMGIYSDVTDPRFNTVGQKFLRGHQLTDKAGVARFTTIYPGWYQGRTVHVHFKVRTTPSAQRGYEFVSQLYFDDAVTDKVHAREPYSTLGQRRQRNRDDGIFRRGGDQLMLAVRESDGGYAGTFDIGLQMG